MEIGIYSMTINVDFEHLKQKNVIEFKRLQNQIK